MDRFTRAQTAGELSERDGAILSAIIERHVLTAEPVSSCQLCLHYAFGYSSASVRNIMAQLEAAGYLSHPYTSAGKIPTVKAYRYFVDRLLATPGEDTQEWQSIRPGLLQHAQEADQMLKLTAGVLAAVSQLLAVGWFFGEPEERLTRVELVRLSSQRILVITLTSRQTELHQILNTPEPISRELLAQVTSLVNEHGYGLSAKELRTLERSEWPGLDRRVTEWLRRAIALVGVSLATSGPAEVAIEGAGNLISQPEFNDIGTVRKLVDMLDHREILLHSFADSGIERGGLRVVIGDETRQAGLPSLSLVTIGVSLQGNRRAHLGVIGPTRMAYGRIFSLLGYTAATVSQVQPGEALR